MKTFFRIDGFTMIELITTISIVAILMGLAIPSFNSSIRSSRLTSYANQMVASLNLARSEAVKRGVQVTVRRKGGASHQWEEGWDIFADVDGSGTMDSDDTLLKTYDALAEGYTMRTGTDGYKDFAAYLSTGLSVSSTSDAFRVCDGTADTTNARSIDISAVGRPSVSEGTDSCP